MQDLLTTVTLATVRSSDEYSMPPHGDTVREPSPAEGVSDLRLSALSFDDHQQTLRMLSLVLVPSGGWLLRHRRSRKGSLQVLFEFERSAAVDIYVMLVALGLELTSNSHLLLTSFCQRTADLPFSKTLQVASCELEIRELADEVCSSEPLFGLIANA